MMKRVVMLTKRINKGAPRRAVLGLLSLLAFSDVEDFVVCCATRVIIT